MNNYNVPPEDSEFTSDVNKLCADFVSLLLDFSKERNFDPIHFVTYVMINMSARQIQFVQFMDDPTYSMEKFMADVQIAYELNHQLYSDAWAVYKEHNSN